MDKATLEAAARVCKKTADLYEDNRTEAFCNGAYSIAIRLYNEILALGDQAPVTSVKPIAILHDDGYWTWIGNTPQQYQSNFAGWRMEVYAAPPIEAKRGTP